MQINGTVVCLTAMYSADELSRLGFHDRAQEVSLEHHNPEQPGPPRSSHVRDAGWPLSAGSTMQLDPAYARSSMRKHHISDNTHEHKHTHL